MLSTPVLVADRHSDDDECAAFGTAEAEDAAAGAFGAALEKALAFARARLDRAEAALLAVVERTGTTRGVRLTAAAVKAPEAAAALWAEAVRLLADARGVVAAAMAAPLQLHRRFSDAFVAEMLRAAEEVAACDFAALSAAAPPDASDDAVLVAFEAAMPSLSRGRMELFATRASATAGPLTGEGATEDGAVFAATLAAAWSPPAPLPPAPPVAEEEDEDDRAATAARAAAEAKSAAVVEFRARYIRFMTAYGQKAKVTGRAGEAHVDYVASKEAGRADEFFAALEKRFGKEPPPPTPSGSPTAGLAPNASFAKLGARRASVMTSTTDVATTTTALSSLRAKALATPAAVLLGADGKPRRPRLPITCMAVDGFPGGDDPCAPSWVFIGSELGDVIAVPWTTVRPDAAPPEVATVTAAAKGIALSPAERFRQRYVRFWKQYNRTKVAGKAGSAHVETIVEAFGADAARQEELFAQLVKKYGREPAAPDEKAAGSGDGTDKRGTSAGAVGGWGEGRDQMSRLVRSAFDASPFRHIPGVRVYCGHVYAVTGLLLFTHKGNDLLATSGADKTIRIAHRKDGRLFQVIAEMRAVAGHTLAYHGGLQRLVVGGHDGVLGLWDPGMGERTTALAKFPAPAAVTCVAVDPPAPGASLAGSARPASAASPPVSPAFDPLGSPGTPGGRSLRAGRAPPAQVVACGLRNGDVYLFRSPARGGGMRCVAALLRPGRQPLIAVDSAIAHVDPATGVGAAVATGVAQGHECAVTAAAVLDAGATVISGDDRGGVCVWSVPLARTRAPRQLRRLCLHVGRISSLNASADGVLVVASHDCLVSVWRWAEGLLVQKLNRHFAQVTAAVLTVSPKFSAAADDTALEGDGDPSEPLGGTLSGEDVRLPQVAEKSFAAARASAVAFSAVPPPFVPCFVSAAMDGEIVAWDFHPDPSVIPRRPGTPPQSGASGCRRIHTAHDAALSLGMHAGHGDAVARCMRFASLCQTEVDRSLY